MEGEKYLDEIVEQLPLSERFKITKTLMYQMLIFVDLIFSAEPMTLGEAEDVNFYWLILNYIKKSSDEADA